MRRIATLLIVLSAVAFAGSESALIEADKAFYRASAERGADGFAGCFDAQEGTLLPKDGAPLVGPSAIAQYLRKRWSEPGYSVQWTPLKAVLAKGGDLGYTYGTIVRKRIKDGQSVTDTGKYVTVWKKQQDGSWKILLDMGN